MKEILAGLNDPAFLFMETVLYTEDPEAYLRSGLEIVNHRTPLLKRFIDGLDEISGNKTAVGFIWMLSLLAHHAQASIWLTGLLGRFDDTFCEAQVRRFRSGIDEWIGPTNKLVQEHACYLRGVSRARMRTNGVADIQGSYAALELLRRLEL